MGERARNSACPPVGVEQRPRAAEAAAHWGQGLSVVMKGSAGRRPPITQPRHRERPSGSHTLGTPLERLARAAAVPAALLTLARETALPRASQPGHHCHLGSDDFCCGGCPVYCETFSSIPGLLLPNVSSNTPSPLSQPLSPGVRQPDMSPDIAEGPLGGQSHPGLRTAVLGPHTLLLRNPQGEEVSEPRWSREESLLWPSLAGAGAPAWGFPACTHTYTQLSACS